jgi:hypothetical protein
MASNRPGRVYAPLMFSQPILPNWLDRRIVGRKYVQQMPGLLVTCLLGTLSDSVMNEADYPALHHRRVRRPPPMTEQQGKPSLTLFWRQREREDKQRGLVILYDVHAPTIWTIAIYIVFRNEN